MKKTRRTADRQPGQGASGITAPVLVFGGTSGAERLAARLAAAGIPTVAVRNERELDRETLYGCLFAFSDEDLENLLICRVARGLLGLPAERMLALCNLPDCVPLYRHEQVRFFREIPDDTVLFRFLEEALRHA